MVKKYKLRIGSRLQVINGFAKMTSGGLLKNHLKINKKGLIISKKASKSAKIRHKNKIIKLKKGGLNKQAGNVFNRPADSVFNRPADSVFNRSADSVFNRSADSVFNRPAESVFDILPTKRTRQSNLLNNKPLSKISRINTEMMRVSEICFIFFGKYTKFWNIQLYNTISHWLRVINNSETKITIIYYLENDEIFECEHEFHKNNVNFIKFDKEFIVNKLQKNNHRLRKYIKKLINCFNIFIHILSDTENIYNEKIWIKYAVRLKVLISIIYTCLNNEVLYLDITILPIPSVNYIDKFKLQKIPKRLLGEFIFPEYNTDGVITCDLFAILSIRLHNFNNKLQFLNLLSKLYLFIFENKHYHKLTENMIWTVTGDFIMELNKTYLKK